MIGVQVEGGQIQGVLNQKVKLDEESITQNLIHNV